MRPLQSLFNLRAIAIIIAIVYSATGNLTNAFHFPWDQGHDTCKPEFPPPPDGDKCDCDQRGSPVFLRTGNFIYDRQDFRIPGTVELELTRTYNARDNRSGQFGRGWTFTYDIRLIPVTDGVQISALWRNAQGRRARFLLNADGVSYTAPADLTSSLRRFLDGWSLTGTDGQVLRFDTEGRLIAWMFSDSQVFSFAYDTTGFLGEVRDRQGRAISFSKGVNGKIESVTDPAGRTFRYSYDLNGNLVGFVDPLGNPTTYVYDPRHNLTQVLDALGHIVHQMAYDSSDRLQSYTDNSGQWSLTYAPGQNRTIRQNTVGDRWILEYDADGFVIRIVDPLTNAVRRVYDANKQMVSSTDEKGNTTLYNYDASGNVTRIQDPATNVTAFSYLPGTSLIASKTEPEGQVTKYEYDAQGNLSREINDFGEPNARATTFSYDVAGNVTNVIEPGGRRFSFAYDTVGNLLAESTVSGTIRHQYDSLGNRVQTIDNAGNMTSYTYDLAGRLVGETNQIGEIKRYEYDVVGNLSRILNPDGTTRTFDYDARGRKVRIVDATGSAVLFEYDSRGNLAHRIDRLGRHTFYEHDALGRMLKRIEKVGDTAPAADADDIVFSYGYDAAGNQTRSVRADGAEVNQEYDYAGRITRQTDAVGRVQTYTYTANGLLRTQTFPNGRVITNHYDSDGMLTSVTDSLGPVASYTYNSAKNLMQVSDGGGAAKSFEYDADDRIVREVDPAAGTTTLSYDIVGRLAQRVDAAGHSTRFRYDPLDRLAAITNRLGYYKSYLYDISGSQVGIADENGNPTTYQHDSVGRLLKTTYAGGGTLSLGYDGNANLITQTNARGQVTRYEYNELNQLTRTVYPDRPAVSYTYDKNGRLLTARSSESDLSFTYDAQGRLTRVTRDGRSIAVSYRPNDSGWEITFPDGQTFFAPFDLRGRPSGWRRNDGTLLVSYGYDNADLLVSITNANGGFSEISHTGAGVISAVNHRNSVGSFYSHQFERNILGNITLDRNLLDTAKSQLFTYDAEEQLLEMRRGVIVGNTIPSPVKSIRYAIDPAGNLTSVTEDGVTENRTFNRSNQLLTRNFGAMAYDADGNLVDDGQYVYVHDSQSRLKEVRDKATDAVLVQYSYDALGFLSSRSSTAGVESYSWLGDLLVERKRGADVEKYLPGPRGPQKAVIIRDSGILFLHTDPLDNVVGVTEGSGALLETYQYDPYGNTAIFNGGGTILNSSAINNPFAFGSHLYDDAIKIYLFSERSYSATLAIYLQRDPAGYVDGLNLYSYVQNNPINRVDASGTTHSVVVNLKPKVSWGGGGFGFSDIPNAKVTRVSVWQREGKTGNKCCKPGSTSSRKSSEYELSLRKVVLDASVDVLINRADINGRGPNGERWYMDCDNVFDTRRLTPANANLPPPIGMKKPTLITVAMTRQHEFFHVSYAQGLLKTHLEGKHPMMRLCPLESAKVTEWKSKIAKMLEADAKTFLSGLQNTKAHEMAARQATCP